MTTNAIVHLIRRLQRLRQEEKNWITPEMAEVAANYCQLAIRLGSKGAELMGDGSLYDSIRVEAYISQQALKDKAAGW